MAPTASLREVAGELNPGLGEATSPPAGPGSPPRGAVMLSIYLSIYLPIYLSISITHVDYTYISIYLLVIYTYVCIYMSYIRICRYFRKQRKQQACSCQVTAPIAALSVNAQSR